MLQNIPWHPKPICSLTARQACCPGLLCHLAFSPDSNRSRVERSQTKRLSLKKRLLTSRTSVKNSSSFGCQIANYRHAVPMNWSTMSQSKQQPTPIHLRPWTFHSHQVQQKSKLLNVCCWPLRNDGLRPCCYFNVCVSLLLPFSTTAHCRVLCALHGSLDAAATAIDVLALLLIDL
jgi:hypothetical protein